MNARLAGNVEIIQAMLQSIGEDPEREGLKDTPHRVVRSWECLYGGYAMSDADVLKTVFEEAGGYEKYDEMILLRDIDFFSTCEHHMLPFFGRAHVAYIPDGCVVGVSKLARLVEVFARRLQIQERMTTQIADAIDEHLKPKGIGVILKAQHFCMTSRGVQKQNTMMVTSAMRGSFKAHHETRSEFLHLVK